MEKQRKLTPADCDRWDTIPEAYHVTTKPTAAQIKLAAEIVAKQQADKAKAAKEEKAKGTGKNQPR